MLIKQIPIIFIKQKYLNFGTYALNQIYKDFSILIDMDPLGLLLRIKKFLLCFYPYFFLRYNICLPIKALKKRSSVYIYIYI